MQNALAMSARGLVEVRAQERAVARVRRARESTLRLHSRCHFCNLETLSGSSVALWPWARLAGQGVALTACSHATTTRECLESAPSGRCRRNTTRLGAPCHRKR